MIGSPLACFKKLLGNPFVKKQNKYNKLSIRKTGSEWSGGKGFDRKVTLLLCSPSVLNQSLYSVLQWSKIQKEFTSLLDLVYRISLGLVVTILICQKDRITL